MAGTPRITCPLRVPHVEGEAWRAEETVSSLAWCLMPTYLSQTIIRGDGISLTADNFKFTDFSESEMSYEGVMFYSTDPASEGYA